MKAVYLQPHGAYRHELHSDTLFGLICWAIRQVFSEARLVELLDGFALGQPPFLLSSAFPCIKDGPDWKPFLPRPLLPPPEPVEELGPDELQRLKNYKRLRYIPVDHFKQFLQGGHSDTSYYKSNIWEDPKVSVPRPVDRLHGTIDRLSGTTDGKGTLFVRPEYRSGGLYFLIDGEAAELVVNALRFLEDFGLGGGNSTGYARFTVTVTDTGLLGKPVAEPDRFVTLSLYYPRPAELAHFRTGEAWYELTVRKGKVGGHFLHADDFWKRSVLMFTPGSTFPAIADRRMYGQNPIVKRRQDGLPFDVQQYGYALAVGMKAARE